MVLLMATLAAKAGNTAPVIIVLPSRVADLVRSKIVVCGAVDQVATDARPLGPLAWFLMDAHARITDYAKNVKRKGRSVSFVREQTSAFHPVPKTVPTTTGPLPVHLVRQIKIVNLATPTLIVLGVVVISKNVWG